MRETPAQLPLDGAEAHVRSILESRKRANASGQLGEDVENIRAAYLQQQTAHGVAPSAPFTKGSWQHAVDDALVEFGKTSQEFDSPHEAVAWLLGVQGEYAVAANAGVHPVEGKSA